MLNLIFKHLIRHSGVKMKKYKFILTIFLVCAFSVFAQTSAKKETKPAVNKAETLAEQREKFDPTRNAEADLQAAIDRAQKENKRIILDVGGEWCGWCRLMDNYLIKNVELGKMRDENFVWVKINMSEENENKEFLAKYPEIKGYPHLFVLEKDGTLLKSKDTSELEDGKSYNLQKFTDFLNEWSPAKNAAK